jgi:hypothetical protein
MIWISSNQIRNIAYFPHDRLIFLTRGQVFEFEPEINTTRIWLLPHASAYRGTFEILEPEYRMSSGDYYGMFGSSIPNHVHGFTTYTERTLEGLSHVTRLANNMLITSDDIESPFEQKVALSIETFRKNHGRYRTRTTSPSKPSHPLFLRK